MILPKIINETKQNMNLSEKANLEGHTGGVLSVA